MAVNTQLQVRRGSASQWTSANPTLAAGEFGFESDTGKFKIGTGSSTWTSLAYASISSSDIPELSQDAIDSALTAGTGITKTYNDAANTLTLAVDTSTIQARVTNVTDTEIGYLDGVTSAIQTQINAKAPLASPTFTGTVVLPNSTVTNDMLAGSIANNKLANSSVTINGSAVSLGGSTTIQAGPDEIAVIMGALI
jgi:Major tropism determinant N-terminal domain